MNLLDTVRRLFQAPAAAYGTTGPRWAQQGTASYGRGAAALPYGQRSTTHGQGDVDDGTAVQRYRYLLRTAPPEQVEQVHAEAFARLTPAQRQQVLEGLAADVPPGERVAAADDPQSLARMATRAEMRRPGTLERVFGGAGVGTGGALVGGLLAGVATAVVGSVLVDSLFDTGFGDSGLFDVGADDPFGFGSFDGGFDF